MKQNAKTLKVELTEKECDLIVSLVGQLNVNPMADDAHDMIDVIRDLVGKLTKKEH